MNEAITIAVSAVTAMFVVGFTEYVKRQFELRRQQAVRLAEFSASAWGATLAIGRIALAADVDKDDLAARLDTDAGDRFNTVLAAVRILDPDELYECAVNVNACLEDLLRNALAEQHTRQGWRDLRATPLEDAFEAFELTARDQLKSSPVRYSRWTRDEA